MRNSSNARRRFPLRWLILLLLASAGLYVGLQLFHALRPTYLYETAVLYTLSDNIEAEGIVLFDESTVAGSGELGYLVEDGERVSAGTAVAEIYTSTSQSSIRTQLKNIDSEIALLQKSQNTSGSQIDLLLAQRSTALYELLDDLDQRNLAQVGADREAYLTAQNKMQITTGAVSDFNTRIGELQAEREALAAQLGSPEQITAAAGGYFTSSQNAAVLTCTRDEAMQMPAGEFSALLRQGAEADKAGLAGKIVSSYQWYFCGICTAEQAERFDGVSSVSICFPGRAEEPLPAQVVGVERDEAAGIAKFTLMCEYIGADVLLLGQEKAQIIFAGYTGLRIDADAVHLVKETVPESASSQEESGSSDASMPAGEDVIINGEHYLPGVYVKYGNIAKFRRITKLYENEEYILVPANGKVGGENEVRMYDEIIVEGTDLYDGKLL